MNAAHIPMHRRRLAAGLVGLVVLAGSAVSQQAFAQTLIDYDTDNDGLIEVDSLVKLDAIRYDPEGDGTPTPGNMSNYDTAFPDPETSMGCPETCEGYELMANLDFNTDGEDGITSNDNVLSWGNGRGWQPIGQQTLASRFRAEFHGNGHTISHLFIHSTDTNIVGLFGRTHFDAVIHSVGLVEVDVTGNDNVGSVAGTLLGIIRASYEPVGLRDNHT